MKCNVCGMDYGLSHNCSGIAPLMTAEEAALRLSDETDQFLVFRDADTSRLGVLYKRKDGNYGLIEP